LYGVFFSFAENEAGVNIGRYNVVSNVIVAFSISLNEIAKNSLTYVQSKESNSLLSTP